MSLRRRTLVLASAAALASTALMPAWAQSWSGSAADDAAIMKLYDEALKAGESEVVIYGAYAGLFRPIWDLFTKRFPKVAIVGNPVSGAQMSAKLDAEFSSKQQTADIVTSGLTELLAAVEQQDLPDFHIVSRGGRGVSGSTGWSGSTGSSGSECQSGGPGGDGGPGGEASDYSFQALVPNVEPGAALRIQRSGFQGCCGSRDCAARNTLSHTLNGRKILVFW